MYGLRGCEPCVSCMGLGMLKELIFLKYASKIYVTSNKTARSNFSTSHCSSIITVCCGKTKILGSNKHARFEYI